MFMQENALNWSNKKNWSGGASTKKRPTAVNVAKYVYVDVY